MKPLWAILYLAGVPLAAWLAMQTAAGADLAQVKSSAAGVGFARSFPTEWRIMFGICFYILWAGLVYGMQGKGLQAICRDLKLCIVSFVKKPRPFWLSSLLLLIYLLGCAIFICLSYIYTSHPASIADYLGHAVAYWLAWNAIYFSIAQKASSKKK